MSESAGGKSLCFHEAYFSYRRKPGDGVARDEYLFQCLEHMRGLRHKYDAGGGLGNLELLDPIGTAIRQISVSEAYEPLSESEAQQYATFLTDAFEGRLDGVRSAFDSIKELRAPHLNPAETIAAVAAMNGHADMLRFALEQGAEFTRTVCFAVLKGKQSSTGMEEMWQEHGDLVNKVLFTRRARRNSQEYPPGKYEPDHFLNTSK